MKDVLEKIKTRGYWRVVIRPSEFVQNRIADLAACRAIVRDSKVDLRGWDYPHFDTTEKPTCGLNFVEQTTDWQDYIEHWRFYQSGQFVHCKALYDDWDDAVTFPDRKRQRPPMKYLSFVEGLFLITEIYEFASRLVARQVMGDRCEVQVGLHNTKDRQLVSFDPARRLRDGYATTLSDIPRKSSFVAADLMVRAADIALDHVVWLYQHFNWDTPPVEVLKQEQKRLLERRF